MSYANPLMLLLVTGMVLALGCDAQAPLDAQKKRLPALVREPQALAHAKAARRMGESCVAPKECLTGICLKPFAGREAPRFCSRRCHADSECPTALGWACLRAYPGPGGKVCRPGPSWTSSVAEVNP